jgi:hypothetical protein
VIYKAVPYCLQPAGLNLGPTNLQPSPKPRRIFIGKRNFGRKTKNKEQINFTMETTPDQKLYDLGSNPLVQDNEGNNPLHFILSKTPCEKSHFDKALALFIDKTPSLIHRKNEGGFKPLHIAIQTARLWPIETLIGTDADIREPDPDGNTILHFLAGNLCSHPLHSNEELISQVRHFLFSWLFDQSGQFLG